jgi:hypothetical protein
VRPLGVLAVAAALVAGLIGGGAVGFVAEGQGHPLDLTSPSPVPAPPAPSPVGPIRLDTMLAWTPGGLPAGFAAAVSRIDGVRHAVGVSSDIAWLTGSWSATGVRVDRPPKGMAIPLEVAAADPRAYAPFLSPADRSVLASLSNGQAVLGSSSARLRHLGPGATLEFGRIRLRVAAILPDAEVGANEVFVSKATGSRLGVTIGRYLLIDPEPGASRSRIAAGIHGALPPGRLAQIRGPGETPFFRQGDAVLPQVKIKELFGEFAARPIAGGYIQTDPAWVASHIVTASVPILGQVRCNRALIPQLRGALGDVQDEGLSGTITLAEFAGCYSSRFLNRDPHAGLSHHAWGVALDINARSNPFGHTPHQDPRLVSVFQRWGFAWGGSWIVPDGMHFEFLRFPSGA